MRLVLSEEGVRNTVMTSEDGQVLYKTSTPFRFGTRMTSLYKVIPNENPEDMQDNFEIIGEIEWHVIGSSTLRLYGEEMKTKDFMPRHGLLRNKRTFKAPDGRSYIWEAEFSVVHVCTCSPSME
ncbi:hypothetical protein F5141DRAFT_1136379 [Pisolithus sp. B1]|nr:hypothetical protein F5141DRAFT_1136379 [Pisolithus sp. B1]